MQIEQELGGVGADRDRTGDDAQDEQREIVITSMITRRLRISEYAVVITP